MSKPINISVPDDLYKRVKKNKQIQISSVCQTALLEAVEGEKTKTSRPKSAHVETGQLGTVLEKIVECIDRRESWEKAQEVFSVREIKLREELEKEKLKKKELEKKYMESIQYSQRNDLFGEEYTSSPLAVAHQENEARVFKAQVAQEERLLAEHYEIPEAERVDIRNWITNFTKGLKSI